MDMVKDVLKEVIVVEGKDDLAAVKKACEAEVIITNGLGISGEVIEQIRTAQARCGVIILTDPDFPGEKIRGMIDRAVPGCRHAFIKQDGTDGTVGSGARKGERRRIGVEYASPQEILEALEKAHCSRAERREEFEMADLLNNGLVGREQAGCSRRLLGEALGLGHTNAKQFLARLNAYGITRAEFAAALNSIREDV